MKFDLSTWFPIASVSDLPYRHVFQGQLLGREYAIWRADDGNINIWENRCLHRGVRLSIGINEGSELKCQYHGWRYANRTAGCTYIPAHPADAPARTICNNTYACQEKYGMIFICFDSESQLDIDDHLGNMAPSLDIWELNQLCFIGEREWVIAENWKRALDVLCDAYCFDVEQEACETNNRFKHAVGYEQFGPINQHHRMTFPNGNIIKLKDLGEQEWGESAEEGFKISHFLFPNVALTISKSTVEWLAVYPGEHCDEQVLRLRSYNRVNENGMEEENDCLLYTSPSPRDATRSRMPS